MRTSRFIASLALAAAASAAFVVVAGPTNPPAGSVASTYKTLSEVEPRTVINATNTPGDSNSVYRISTPGSYYLDRFLSGASGKHCIEIEADNVTIDLMGFTLFGTTGHLDGINVPGARRNIVIRNGIVREFAGSGIYATNVVGGELSDLLVTNNTLDGVWPAGQSTVRNVRSVANGRNGFVLGSNAGILLRDCVAQNNRIGFDGASASSNTYECCVAKGSVAAGFRAWQDTRFTRCEASNCFLGFEFVGARCEAFECSSLFNFGNGFTGGQANAVINSLAANNGGVGIQLDGYSEVRGCRLLQNTMAGINVVERSSVVGCQVTLGSARGINATGFGCRIENNHVQQNQLEGIVIASATTVLNNSLDFNGSAAGTHANIRVTGGNNRIEANHCVGADIGLKLDVTAGNIAIRNICRGNSINYDPASSPDMGPVHSASTSTNPWANLQ